MTWDGPTIEEHYQNVPRAVAAILDAEEPGYLATVEFEEYLDYLVDRLALEPLEWHADQATAEPFTTRVKRYDRFFEKEFNREETRFRVRVPLSAHSSRRDYFRLGPATTWFGRSEPDWRFEGDTLLYEVDAAEGAVERGLEDVEFWLGNRNGDIAMGNKNLRKRVQSTLEDRKRRLEEQNEHVRGVIQNLKIPLHQSPDSAKPVAMKPRKIRTVLTKPQPKAPATEPTLSRDDVVELVDFIEQYARQFEVTPAPFLNMKEEELRDVLIGMMNANYPGSTTAETFNKLGKTDIAFRVDEGNVLICECKFWSGQKAYSAALIQLFRYLTWRQNYGVLIHFCTLKNMTKAVSDAKESVASHSSHVPGTTHVVSDTRFLTRHKHPQDPDKLVEVFHLFFDLSI